MSEVATKHLPEGWAEAQLSELTERITKGSTPTSYGYEYKTEGVKFVKAENIDATGHATTTSNFIDNETHEFLSRSKLKENDLLFSIAGTIGRVGVVRDIDLPANTNQALAIIRLIENSLDIKYLFYFLNSPQIQAVAIKNIVGVGRANLSLKNIGEFRIPVAPPEQQERIVAKIEELFSHIDVGIEALKKAKQLLKQYRQSVLKAAVTGELTKEWREANKDDAQGSANVAGGRTPGATKLEPAFQLLERILKERRQKWEQQQLEQFKAKGKMPKDDKWKGKYKEPVFEGHADLEVCKDWAYVSLDMIPDAIDPNPSHRMPKYVDKGIPFISTDNFEGQNEIDFSKGKKVAKETYKNLIEKYYIEKGDFAFSRIGTIGKTRLLPTDREYCLSHSLSVIKIKFSEVCSNYLRHVMSSKDILKQALHGVQSVGVPDLGMAKIRNFEIPFPSLKEQELISEIIGVKTESITRLENELEHQLIKAEKNKQSILASAFSGKITNG
ncbi:MAG: restriction endonuclease subunit S [Candidatus Thiodiazotropha sp. (ex. Lucinoma kazani)]